MSKSVILSSFSLAVLLCLSACGENPPVSPDGAETETVPLNEVSDAEPPVMVGGRRQLTPEEKKQAIDGVMQARAKQQAEGLGTGSVKVNGAWNYSGYSYLSPDPAAAIEARLVAVDVTISGHTPFFDIDDVEIVDGLTLISYGSDPHAENLKPDGTLRLGGETLEAAPGASRWLLIYAFPKNTPRFHLYYWGKQLTPKPVEVGDSGPGLPYPQAE